MFPFFIVIFTTGTICPHFLAGVSIQQLHSTFVKTVKTSSSHVVVCSEGSTATKKTEEDQTPA